ncbi:MAG: hypothetical protein M1444_02710 [Patescibacteria group bacterium]|nr:hypothetical protein [Patescibacteria group bacterium]
MVLAVERIATRAPKPHSGEVINFPLRPPTEEERRMRTIDEQRSKFPMQKISELSGGDVFMHHNEASRRAGEERRLGLNRMRAENGLQEIPPEPEPVFPDLPEFHYG